MSEETVLEDTGYLVNFLQKGGVKHLKLTLTSTHLKIVNAVNGEPVDDIPIDQIKSVKATNIVFAVFLSTQGTNLEIKTDAKTYKISWKNVDLEKVAFGQYGQSYNAFNGYKKSKLWASTIKKLHNHKTTQSNESASNV